MAVGTQDLRFRVLAQVVGAQAIDSLKGSFDSLDRKTSALATGLKALAAAYSVREAIQFGRQLLDAGDNLSKLSQKTGASVEQLAKLQEQAELSGVSFEGLTGGLRKLSVTLVDAANGNSEASAAFKKLGIDVRDSNGNVKQSGDVLEKLQVKFASLKDGPEKAALAIKLFGKSGSDLIPFLNSATGEVSRFAQAMDSDFASRAERFNDTLSTIGLNIKGAAIQGLKQLLPAIQEIAEAFKELSADDTGTSTLMEDIGEGARLTGLALVTFLTPAVDLLDMAVSGIRMVGLAFKGESAKILEVDAKLAERIKARKASQDKFGASLMKNSLYFGDGTTDEIRARQKKATAPDTKKPGSGAQLEATGIGDGSKVIGDMEAKLKKMRAETETYGQSNAAREKAVLLAELESKGIDKNSAAYAKLSSEIASTVDARELKKELDATKEFEAAQREEIELRRLEMQQVNMTQAEYQKLIETKKTEADIRKTTRNYTLEGAAAHREAAEAIRDERIALIDLQEQQRQTWTVGAKSAMQEYVRNAQDTASQTKSLFMNAFQNMEDSLVSFVKTGQLNFAKFADDLITDIIRIQVRAAMAQAIVGVGSMFASGGADAPATMANGGIVGPQGSMPLKTYARGGIATSPQVAIFGEGSMNEAYVPLPDGRSIPVTMKADGSGSGGGDVNVTVNVSVEKGSENTQSDSTQGAQLGKMISAVVRSEILQQKRPGGLLA